MWKLTVYVMFFALETYFDAGTRVVVDEQPVFSEIACRKIGHKKAQEFLLKATRKEILPPASMTHRPTEYRVMVICKAPEK